jgi:hypothetical protein
MSTAGIYNAWPAVIHGTKPYLHNQMKSQQAPFYFGGSQVPINLQPEPHAKQHSHINGNGLLSMVAKDVGKQLIRKHVLGEGIFNMATDDEYKSPPSRHHTNYETRGSMLEAKTGGRYNSYDAGQGRGLSEHVRGLDDVSRTEAEANIAEWNIQNDRKKRAQERVREQNEKMEQEQKERVRANDKFGSFSSMLKNRLPPASTAPTAPAPIQAPSTQRLSLIRPSGSGMMEEAGSFMGALGMGINDPHTYRKHSTALRKSIGSNTYRLAKV